MSVNLEPRFADPDMDTAHCDQCGADATQWHGWNPPNAAMRIMVRCDEHNPTRRELAAISSVLGL